MSATKTATGAATPTTTKQPAKAGAKASISACSHEGHQGKVCEDVVREKAYLKWEKAGYPSGDGVQFWLEAESELVQESA